MKEGASRSILRGIIQHDTLNEVNIRLSDGSRAFDYTGYTNIVFKVLKADGTSYIAAEGESVIATSPVDGIVTVILAGQATAVAGMCQSVIEIYSGADKMTTARFNYEVFESLGVDEAAVSEDHYPVFQTLLADLSELEANVEQAEDQRVSAEAARASTASGYVARAEQAAADAEMWARAAQDIIEGDYATRAELEAVKADAAPAGFGLGGVATQLTSNDDLNTIYENGWYYWGSSAPANAPKQVVTEGEAYVLMRVNSSHSTNVVQEYWSLNYNMEIQTRRICRDGVWGELEFINPPMWADVEYRTTERFLGKPVYTKLINAGTLPNAGVKTIAITSDVATIRYLISATGVDITTGQILPSGAFGGDSSRQVFVGGNRSGVTIQTNFDGSSANNVYLTLKYTKTTDT